MVFDNSNHLYSYVGNIGREDNRKGSVILKSTNNISEFYINNELTGIPSTSDIKYLIENYEIGLTRDIFIHNSIISKNIKRDDISESWIMFSSLIPDKYKLINKNDSKEYIKLIIDYYIEQGDIFHYIFMVLSLQEYCIEIYSKDILKKWYNEFISLLRSLNLHTEATKMCRLNINPNLLAREHEHEQVYIFY